MSRAIRFAVLAFVLVLPAYAQSDAPPGGTTTGAMTLERMETLIARIDENAKRDGHMWEFTIEDVPVVVVTDENNDRMRILVAIRPVDGLEPGELLRMMQANFDSALDARYAVAQNVLWSAFVHPLASLRDAQFLSAIGQTVNLARTYGSSYTSGALMFGGGDSEDLLRRRLIDELIERGQPT